MTKRVVRGALAVGALLALLVGTPVLLWWIANPSRLAAAFTRAGGPGANPLEDLLDFLLRRDDGTVLIGLISVVAWLVWALFAVSIVVELVNAVRSFRGSPAARIRLPGLRLPQAVAAGLVLAAVSLVVAPVRATAPAGTAGSAAAATPPAAVAVATAVPAAMPYADPTQHPADHGTQTGSRGVVAVHQVVAGDHLWGLAEQYYDDGGRWRAIARANPVLRHHGPDDLQVGWQLVVPRLDESGQTGGASYVVAAPGDTLSSLAADHLGGPGHWPELYEANRAVLSDPDDLAAGTVLALPATDNGGRTNTAGIADERPGQLDQPAPEAAEPPTTATAGQTSTGSGETDGERRTEPPPAAPESDGIDDGIDRAAVTRGVGGMLAAAVLAGLAVRRIQQLRVRPVGRRISHPGPPATQLAQAFGRGHQQHAMQAVDRAMRLVAAHCRAEDLLPPRVQQIRVGRALELTLADAVPDAPAPFLVDGRVWSIPDLTGWLATPDPHPDGVRPWPAMVTIGATAADETLLVNLEEVATLGCDRDGPADDPPHLSGAQLSGEGGADPDVTGVLTAIACELAFQPWAAGTRTVVLVDDVEDADWVTALDSPDVTVATDADQLIGRLEQRARAQRAELDGRWGPTCRLHPDQAEAWAAEVVVVLARLSGAQRARLCRVVDGPGRTTQAVVLAGCEDTRAGLRLDRTGAHLHLPPPQRHPGPPVGQVRESDGLAAVSQLRPHHVSAEVAADITDLLVGTAGPTTPAPWWAGSTVAPPAAALSVDLSTIEPTPAGPGGDADLAAGAGDADAADGLPGAGRRARRADDGATASMLGLPPARARGVAGARPGEATIVRLPSAAEVRERTGRVDNGPTTVGTGGRDDGAQQSSREVFTVPQHVDEAPAAPIVRLVGPIELVGARGVPPTRARKQCVEYCAWLLEHPGSTATAMANALVVAEGTRRSNMSRLRSWLGEGDDGPFLPDAYSGRISLHDSVSSDWDQLQLLVGRGVDRAGDGALMAALELVRGAPLADAAPGQWVWAEELRTDIASVVRDIGVELSGRALTSGNLDLARWAAARALVAAPSDELLLGQRIRTEHAAGNRRDVDRLAMQLATQSRRLGVDLADETVELLQFVVEGAVRAREV